MKIVISPAKSLDFERELPTKQHSEAAFLKEANSIQKVLKKKKPKQLAALMDISEKLAELNGVLQIVLAQRRTYKKAGKHRLTDILFVHDAAERGVGQAYPNLTLNECFVVPHQICRGLIVSGAQPAQQRGEIGVGHGWVPWHTWNESQQMHIS